MTTPSSTQTLYMMSAEGECHQNCRVLDAAQMQCVNGCMPKVQKCIGRKCANYSVGTSEQMSCSQTCQKDCRQSCSEPLQQAQDCHQSCIPAGRRNCLSDCEASYDDSCMQTCGPQARQCCMNCSKVASDDPKLSTECQKKCYEDACGKDCAETSTNKQTCTNACYAPGTSFFVL
eukprot:TRINITY_DN30991_c0_g1_i1.p1 TRINITY_DN30991_c0_g1~~TRINITY_DN30991_c0_g1_i1.p1  ORF type:complete len:191 (-),score=30.70 TRINITY_DN30991_c0_g1_i1:117-641(-)